MKVFKIILCIFICIVSMKSYAACPYTVTITGKTTVCATSNSGKVYIQDDNNEIVVSKWQYSNDLTPPRRWVDISNTSNIS